MEILIDLVLDFLGLFDRSNTPAAAYRSAWKKREVQGTDDIELLVKELKERSVPGAYDQYDSERLAPLLSLWGRAVPPKEARRELKRLKRLAR